MSPILHNILSVLGPHTTDGGGKKKVTLQCFPAGDGIFMSLLPGKENFVLVKYLKTRTKNKCLIDFVNIFGIVCIWSEAALACGVQRIYSDYVMVERKE